MGQVVIYLLLDVDHQVRPSAFVFFFGRSCVLLLSWKFLDSPVLGMAWLEIRRATSIDVNEVSTRERKLTIHWVTSDRPDSGTPYATFIFNFELSEQAMERINGGLQSNPTTPSTRGRIGARSSSAEGETEGAIPSSPDIMMDDIPVTFCFSFDGLLFYPWLPFL